MKVRLVMRIIVASEESSTRAAIGILIRAQGDLELCGEATDVADLLLAVKANRPDVIVLDWDDLGQRIETLHELLEFIDDPPSIVAVSLRDVDRASAMNAGVLGFALKSEPPSQLLDVIRQSDEPSTADFSSQDSANHD